MVQHNKDNDLNDNKLINLDSVTVNRNPTLNNELANKNYIDNELDKITILRFNQTLQNYLKVSVGNDTYNFTKYNKCQLTDTTIIKNPNSGGYLLQNWVINCNDKRNNGKIQNFVRSTKINSPTGQSGAESLAPIGTAFMYIETSGSNSGNENLSVSWERTDNIQNTNKSSYYNIRHRRSLLLLLSLVEPDILKQSKFTDDEIDIFKNIALENLHRQRNLKEYFALQLLDKHIDNKI